jgi:hypothetical protein
MLGADCILAAAFNWDLEGPPPTQEVRINPNASKASIAESKDFFLLESILFFSYLFLGFNLSDLRIEKQAAQFRIIIGANSKDDHSADARQRVSSEQEPGSDKGVKIGGEGVKKRQNQQKQANWGGKFWVFYWIVIIMCIFIVKDC